MKIALIHDHLAQDGGAENMVRVFADIWPDAPIFVTVWDPNHAHPFFKDKDIRTSFLQRWPFGVKRYQWWFPWMPLAVESFDLSEFDVVLASSSSFAKGVITRPETLHITYCHTPTRFLWSDTHSYVNELSVNRLIKKWIPLFLSRVRLWDRIAADRTDLYLANSRTVKQRIQKYYRRESEILYPPVDVKDFQVAQPSEIGDYFLAGGRLVPYKRFDLLVEAFNKLGRPLKIFGSGPALADLKRQAASNIEFVGRIPDAELKQLFARCQAFLNPQEEDFGITMIEALASGRPVIAYSQGGASDIIEHNVHGLLIDYQTWEDFADAVLCFDHTNFDPAVIRERALTFDQEQFKKTIQAYVEKQYIAFKHNE